MALACFHHTILSILLLSGNILNDFGILSMTGTVLFSIKSKNIKANIEIIYSVILLSYNDV